MKKAIVWLLALTLCLTLCACGDKQDSAAGTNPGTTAPTAGQQENKPTGTTPENTQNTVTTEPTQGGEATAPSAPGEDPKPTAPAPTTPAHTHSWKAATCTAPKTCSCGATEGAPIAHSLTAKCTMCGKDNAGFVEVANHSWAFMMEKDGRITDGEYTFYSEGGETGVNVGYSFFKKIEQFAQEYNMTVEQVRAEYAPMEMIKTINGMECVYDGWGMDNASDRRYKEENGKVTVEFLSLDWDNYDKEVWTVVHTVVLTRTGLAELTITSSDYTPTPVGLKLTAKAN